jgi:hypothetical protein
VKKFVCSLLIGSCAILSKAQHIVSNTSGVHQGAIRVAVEEDELTVRWSDKDSRRWITQFSLDAAQPLISMIAVDGKTIVTDATPVYRCTTGKRRGGWDAFFDFPPAAADGTRQFIQEFHPTRATARTVGNRVEVNFDGMQLGIFKGDLRYTFYPRSALIEQTALLSTAEPDTAFYYDAGMTMTSAQDIRSGGNMDSSILFYDENGKLTQQTSPYGPERHSLQVRYRTVAAKMGSGGLAVFPPPHRYFFARDYTTNQGYVWYSAWRGRVGMGVQQYSDDNTRIDPWMNAPPGTVQEMTLFLLPSADGVEPALKQVLSYTHQDHFPHLDGFVTFAPHWHLAFTVQELEKGARWVPPFKPIMEAAGIDSAMIMDFHLDGHPADLTNLRLNELKEYYKACKAQSDLNFLLIPSEEANIYLGGHWGIVFPKLVYWMQDRKPGQPLKSAEPGYGNVYRVHNSEEVWGMIKSEGAWAYQTHPRTKGSTGFPDKILNAVYFRDDRYLGTGWKSMPSDLSLPQLGDRAFKTLDDINNLGFHKHLIGEIDVFQLNATDELYGLLNLNYLRLRKLPDFDHYDEILESVQKGDGFISTGEVLFDDFSLRPIGTDRVHATARVSNTFPLRLAEIVWGDGTRTHREAIDLSSSDQFQDLLYDWESRTPGWTWARLEVWDVAGNGAFTQPIWKGTGH